MSLVACVVPIAMQVFGQLKLILFLQRDIALGRIVCLVMTALVLFSLQDGVSQDTKR